MVTRTRYNHIESTTRNLRASTPPSTTTPPTPSSPRFRTGQTPAQRRRQRALEGRAVGCARRIHRVGPGQAADVERGRASQGIRRHAGRVRRLPALSDPAEMIRPPVLSEEEEEESAPAGDERCAVCGSALHTTSEHPLPQVEPSPAPAPPSGGERCAICGSAFHTTAQHTG